MFNFGNAEKVQNEKGRKNPAFFVCIIKFSCTFFKRCRIQRRGAFVALRRARNLVSALFFLIAFSFAPAYAKEKADSGLVFLFRLLAVLGFCAVGANIVRPQET